MIIFIYLFVIPQQDPHSLAGPTASRTVIALDGESNSGALAHYNTFNYNAAADKRHEETQSPMQPYSASHHPQHYGFVHPALSHSIHDDYYSDYNRINAHHKEYSNWTMEDPNCDTSINNLRSKLIKKFGYVYLTISPGEQLLNFI